MGLLAGDPYSEKEVSRNAAVNLVQTSPLQGVCTPNDSLGKQRQLSAFRFPPAVPSDPFFKLESTTLVVSTRSPWRIGELLLDFLSTWVVVYSLKVKPAKCSIKSRFLHDGIPCCLKIKVYSMDSTTYAVEVQRRSGDVVVFNEVFRALTGFLEVRLAVVHGQSAQVEQRSLPPLDSQMLDAVDFEPLINLGARSSMLPKEFRAELASAFARAVWDGHASALSGEDALAALSCLLEHCPRESARLAADSFSTLASTEDRW